MDDDGGKWTALVLAAGRGPDDPMARAFGARHKCLLEVGGRPMLARVVAALRGCGRVGRIFISIDDAAAARAALGGAAEGDVFIIPSAESAAASVLAAVNEQGAVLPLLATTADHALLDGEMLEHFLSGAERMEEADLAVGLAARETVMAAWPETRRTWMRFGRDAVTGCNLFALKRPEALRAVSFWRRAEKNRKKPWKIAFSFGLWPLLKVILGLSDLEGVMADASRRLGLVARPVLMPMAEASIDVDKPSDLELAEKILAERDAAQGRK